MDVVESRLAGLRVGLGLVVAVLALLLEAVLMRCLRAGVGLAVVAVLAFVLEVLVLVRCVPAGLAVSGESPGACSLLVRANAGRHDPDLE